MSAVLKEAETLFRTMSEADLVHVLEIEEAVYDFPWSIVIFRDCLGGDDHCLLMEQGGVIIGYGIMSVVAGEAHILNLCIKPDLQSQGWGQKLLRYLMEFACYCDAGVIFLEVRSSNWRALRVYEKLGFHEVGGRRDYYRARIGREDALILAKQLVDHEQSATLSNA